jgi:hypothetical protein
MGSLVVGYDIANGTTGINVGPMLPAPGAGQFARCVVVVKSSDSTDCHFMIKQNGVGIFTTAVVIPAGSLSGTLMGATNFTQSPLPVAKDDVFSIDILAGSGVWQFTAQLE